MLSVLEKELMPSPTRALSDVWPEKATQPIEVASSVWEMAVAVVRSTWNAADAVPVSKNSERTAESMIYCWGLGPGY
jgi:hypothetical protein